MCEDEMDVGEMWKAHKEEGQKKRDRNRESSANILDGEGINFDIKNGGVHLVVYSYEGIIDFWPGTGKWIARNGKVGRGVFKLIKYLKSFTRG